MLERVPIPLSLCDNNRGLRFSVRGFGCALFVFGGIMRRVDKLGRIVIEDNILATKGEC